MCSRVLSWESPASQKQGVLRQRERWGFPPGQDTPASESLVTSRLPFHGYAIQAQLGDADKRHTAAVVSDRRSSSRQRECRDTVALAALSEVYCPHRVAVAGLYPLLLGVAGVVARVERLSLNHGGLRLQPPGR